MSSADATVGDTVIVKQAAIRSGDTARATVFALLLATQLAWIGVLAYLVVWLLA
jgi:hypothetical protein